jgi:hypothetical protein
MDDSLPAMLKEALLTLAAECGVRVMSDYLPPMASRIAEYEWIPESQLKLGSRPEFAALARCTHYLARRAAPVIEGRT